MPRVSLDWIELAAIVGAIQGLVLVAVIASKRTNRSANALLAILIAAMTVYLAAGPYYSTGLVRAHPHFLAINYQTTWVFGPLVYLYAHAASDRSWRFGSRHLVHFVPVAVTTLAAMPVYLMSGAEKVAVFDQWSAHGVSGILAYLDPFKYASGVGYSAATVLYLARHRREVEHSYSNVERVNLRWLSWLTFGTGAIWVMVTGLKIAQVSTSVRDAHVAVSMSILVYAIGYMGLRQPEVFKLAVERWSGGAVEPAAVIPPAVIPTLSEAKGRDLHSSSEPRYERSGLSEGEAKALEAALLRVMEKDQPWKESELTLAELAERLGSTPHKLSEVLNSRIGVTFYDFVNGYRVREVQRRIRAGEARSLKMLALAMDAGFASKTTFNDAFRKHTSQTPSAYRQAVGA